MMKKVSVSPEDKAGEDDGTETDLNSAKTSRSVLFQIDNGVRWPHLAVVVTNLVLSVPVLILILTFFFLATTAITQNPTNSKPDYGIPGKFYCPSFIQWSLLIEFTAQLIYTVGSVLLLIGAFKNHQVLCYVYVICGMISFIIAALIRSAQFIICENRDPANSPGKVRPVLPPLFKLTFIWLVCQLFWYWLVLSMVAALMKWIQTEEIGDMVRKTPPPEENKY